MPSVLLPRLSRPLSALPRNVPYAPPFKYSTFNLQPSNNYACPLAGNMKQRGPGAPTLILRLLESQEDNWTVTAYTSCSIEKPMNVRGEVITGTLFFACLFKRGQHRPILHAPRFWAFGCSSCLLRQQTGAFDSHISRKIGHAPNVFLGSCT